MYNERLFKVRFVAKLKATLNYYLYGRQHIGTEQ